MSNNHHAFTKRILSWPYCAKCGLVALKNPFTAWAIRVGCDYDEHPDYERRRAATGNPTTKEAKR